MPEAAEELGRELAGLMLAGMDEMTKLAYMYALKPGDQVIVVRNHRSRGTVGGWRPHSWVGEVVKVNKKTVDVQLQYPGGQPFVERVRYTGLVARF